MMREWRHALYVHLSRLLETKVKINWLHEFQEDLTQLNTTEQISNAK